MTAVLTGVGRWEVSAALLGASLGLAILSAGWLPVAAVAAVALVVAALRHPPLLVPALFLSILLESVGNMGLHLAGVPMTLSKLTTLTALMVWVIHAGQARRPLFEWQPVTAGFLAVIFTMILSMGRASSTGADATSPLLGVIGLTLLTHLIAAMVPVSALRWQLRAIGVITFVVLLTAVLGAERIESVEDARYSGSQNDPNDWCNTLGLIVPLTLASMARERSPAATPLLLGLTALYPLNVIQSLSRAGLLVMVGLTPFIVWLVWPRRFWFILAVLSLPFVLPFVVDFHALVDRYATLVDPASAELDGSLRDRTLLAQVGLEMLRDEWLLGIGAGMFPFEASYRTSGAVNKIAHNTYLTVAVEQGLIGVVAHAILFWQIAAHTFRCLRQSRTPVLKSLSCGYLASVLNFAAMSMTLNNMTVPMAYFILGIGLVLERATRLSDEELVRMDL